MPADVLHEKQVLRAHQLAGIDMVRLVMLRALPDRFFFSFPFLISFPFFFFLSFLGNLSKNLLCCLSDTDVRVILGNLSKSLHCCLSDTDVRVIQAQSHCSEGTCVTLLC